MTSITARTEGQPLFDTFVNTLAEPLLSEELPEPTDIDGGQVAQVGAAHNITVLGPPPPPLD